MGNSANANVGIHVQLNNDVVSPGEAVSGTVHVSIKGRADSPTLLLRLKGEERTYRTQGEELTHVGYHLICDRLETIGSWEHIESGEFAIPFRIILPRDLVGTVSIKRPAMNYIYYAVEAQATFRNGAVTSNEVPVIVKHIFRPSTCSPKRAGPVVERIEQFRLAAHVERQRYRPGDTAIINVAIDTRDGVTDVNNLFVRWVKEIEYRYNSSRPFQTTTFLTNQSLLGVRCGVQKPVMFKVQVPLYHNYFTGDIDYSVSSKLITCRHFLQVTRKFSLTPLLQVEIYILPRYDELSSSKPLLPAPIDWEPAEMDKVEPSIEANSNHFINQSKEEDDEYESEEHQAEGDSEEEEEQYKKRTSKMVKEND